jgi:hypothetical protein
MQQTLLAIFMLISLTIALPVSARCDYPENLDSIGRRCGGRAASVRPGGYEPSQRESPPASKNNKDKNKSESIDGVSAPSTPSSRSSYRGGKQ